jgi:hypothetical protein
VAHPWVIQVVTAISCGADRRTAFSPDYRNKCLNNVAATRLNTTMTALSCVLSAICESSIESHICRTSGMYMHIYRPIYYDYYRSMYVYRSIIMLHV